VDGRACDAGQVSAALLAIEDRITWDAAAMLEAAVSIERRAVELGDEFLAARARLCQTNMLMRKGDIAGAARRIFDMHEWAVEHDARRLHARAHLVWANIHRLLGDAPKCLEHSLSAVELLDETATPHMQVWHRVKLADALAFADALEAARLHYAQSEELAVDLQQPRLLMSVLNNHAYAEFAAGENERAQAVALRLQQHAGAHGFDLAPSALDTIGAIQIQNGRYAEAEQTLQECISRHDEGQHEDADALAEYLLTLAKAQRGLGATDQAQASLDASRALCRERDLQELIVRVHQEQAELHAARGEFAEAFAVHKEFFAAHDRLHSLKREAQARTRHAMFETAEAREDAERFREQARRDPLTGLRNRRYVDEQLPALIDAGIELTVAIVDLDHFKRVNDRLSHDVGDKVLDLVARLLEREVAAVSPDGFTARMGGEEFLVVLPGTPVREAVEELDGIRRTVAGHAWGAVTHGLPVTVSIGVAGLREAPMATQSALLSIADRNLYVAKRGGRDRVVAGIAGEGRARSFRDTPAA
jgi:diguanylate cyclase (GGDEF)-like protein